jgi:hypothetical protein
MGGWMGHLELQQRRQNGLRRYQIVFSSSYTMHGGKHTLVKWAVYLIDQSRRYDIHLGKNIGGCRKEERR